LTVDCERVLAQLDGLVQHATQRFPVAWCHDLQVWRADGGYRIHENGPERNAHGSPRAVAELLVRRMNEIALSVLPEFTKVHAGCAGWRGKRFLAVGPALSGKSTLMARLLFEDFAVHGDDLVLLRRGEVLPFPRRFLIRRPTVGLIPQLAALTPEEENHGSMRELALDPSALGFAWDIEAAPVDVVFFLEPNRGGATWLEVCQKFVMAERVMSLSSPPAGGARDWIRDICAMLARADCYVLRFGDLEAAVSIVREALRSTSGA
jgi:hypothetical protein